MSYEAYAAKRSTDYLYRKRNEYLARIDMCQDYLNTMFGRSYLGVLGAEVAIKKYSIRAAVVSQELARRSEQ